MGWIFEALVDRGGYYVVSNFGSGFFLNGPIHPQKKVNVGSNAINNLIIKADSLDQY